MDRERQTSTPETPLQLVQATKRYQTLLPAAESSPIPRSLTTDPNRRLPPKRKLVLVACSRCRQKKEKCDGERPSCGRCITKAAECQYEVDDAKVSRTSALKRKCDALQDENERLRELFGLLRQKSKPEAQDILSRIRGSHDPLAVWRAIKDAELLLPWAGSASGSASGHKADPRLEKIDAEAWAGSFVKVKARPWTAVAGDGVVSDLVASFFTWDNPFQFSFVDKDCFLTDMTRGDPERARFCSPFLVNAMCAFRCYTSARAKAFSAIAGEDLTARFSNEAKRLLALERGRSSLATAQGLVLLFMTTVFDGTDRAHMMYRLLSCEMMKQLSLEAELETIGYEPSKKEEKRALSKALWGHFIFENMVAYTYLQPSLTSPPRISSPWLETKRDEELGTADEPDWSSYRSAVVLGRRPAVEAKDPPQRVSGVLAAASETAKLLYEAMKYNSAHDVIPGSTEDLRVRGRLYSDVLDFRDSLPARLQSESNFTPQTCLLSVLLNEAAIGILRPLRLETAFGPQGLTVRDLTIALCNATISLLERHVALWPLAELPYSYTIICCTNNVALAMVPLLDSPKTHDAFATACGIMDASARDFPISTYVLQGVQALAWAIEVEIPTRGGANRVLEAAAEAGVEEVRELRDLPVALRIPYLDAAGKPPPKMRTDVIPAGNVAAGAATAQGAELGVLLARWSAMTIRD